MTDGGITFKPREDGTCEIIDRDTGEILGVAPYVDWAELIRRIYEMNYDRHPDSGA